MEDFRTDRKLNHQCKIFNTENTISDIFPHHMAASPAQRVIFLACGSFNPPTNMHLRLFELARDHYRAHQPLSTVLGGVISPILDAYAKASLISSRHRLALARLAVVKSSMVKVSDWEVKQ